MPRASKRKYTQGQVAMKHPGWQHLPGIFAGVAVAGAVLAGLRRYRQLAQTPALSDDSRMQGIIGLMCRPGLGEFTPGLGGPQTPSPWCWSMGWSFPAVTWSRWPGRWLATDTGSWPPIFLVMARASRGRLVRPYPLKTLLMRCFFGSKR